MGLLDQLAGQVLGSVLSNQSGGASPLLAIAQQLIQQSGGIEGLLAKLQSGGLSQQAASWVGTGANLPVDGSQLSQALGGDLLGQLAGQAGMDSAQLSGGLAQLLPQLIDQATPNGTTAGADDLLGQGLGALAAMLNKS